MTKVATNTLPSCLFVAVQTMIPVATTAASFQAQGSLAAPPAAISAGYTTHTFGPAVTIGKNWQAFSFFGVSPSRVNATQNPDGSVTIAGGGDTYNAQLCTASSATTGNLWRGTAFGGGGYFEATLSLSGPSFGLYRNPSSQWPAFWANDIEAMSRNPLSHWHGQMAQYDHAVEIDFMEMLSRQPFQYGTALHEFYGPPSGTREISIGTFANVPVGTDFSRPHKYGALWVPATAALQGYVQFYFDGEQVASTQAWHRHNPISPPPPVLGLNAFSIVDARHLALLLGTGPNSPLTVYSVSVWQASSADNISVDAGQHPRPPQSEGVR